MACVGCEAKPPWLWDKLAPWARDGEVPQALRKMIGESALPMTQRCLAANALGQLNYNGATLAGEPYLEAVAGLASDILASEQQQTSPSRRRLRSNLLDTLAALKGADPQHKGIGELATKPAEQQLVKSLKGVMEPLFDSLDDSKLAEEDLISKIGAAEKALDSALKKRSK